MKVILVFLASTLSTSLFAGDQCLESKILADVKFVHSKNEVMRNHFIKFKEGEVYLNANELYPNKTTLSAVDQNFRAQFHRRRNPFLHYLSDQEKQLLALNPKLLFKQTFFRKKFLSSFHNWINLDIGDLRQPPYDATVTYEFLDDKIWACVTGNESAALCYPIKYTDFAQIDVSRLISIPYLRMGYAKGVVYSAIYEGIDFEWTPTVEDYVKKESADFCAQKVLSGARSEQAKEEGDDSKLDKIPNGNSKTK